MTPTEWLHALTEVHAASGREENLYRVLEKGLQGAADRFARDGAGNLLALRDGSQELPLLLLAAHADQVTLYTRVALPGGYLRLRAPGVDVRCLPGLTVEVDGRPGVIGMLPPHLRKGTEPSTVREEDLYIDLGASAEEELPVPGTPVHFRVAPRSLGHGRFSAPGLDNRASVAALCVLLEELRGEALGVRLAVAFTAGEEVGRGGAAYLGAACEPDLAIAVDVTYARQPELSEQDQYMDLGGGPAIGVGPNVAPFVLSLLVQAAQAAGVHAQREPLPGDSGTDGWALQVGRQGVPTGVLSIPLTSMHSPAEVVSVDDVRMTSRLLAALCRSGFPREGLQWD